MAPYSDQSHHPESLYMPSARLALEGLVPQQQTNFLDFGAQAHVTRVGGW